MVGTAGGNLLVGVDWHMEGWRWVVVWDSVVGCVSAEWARTHQLCASTAFSL